MEDATTYVGLDVHKKMIRFCALLPEGELLEGEVANEAKARRRLGRKVKRLAPGALKACYEAGPCGYVLQREWETEGIRCAVIAPSLIPVRPGQRVKTDRRDALKLAQMLRSDLLEEVHPPNEEEEAVRDLCRAREDAKQDQLRARHRLGKFLLRWGLVWREGRNWTQAHRQWLKSLEFEHPAARRVFQDYLVAVTAQEERVRGLEEALEEISREDPYREPVGWLRCFRGIDTVTAMTLMAEIHDFRRFATARALMAYLGLVPSEHSSGERQRQGGITKTGNSHARRVLVESAWHARHLPAVGKGLHQRRNGQPAWVIAMADKAQRRLHRRYWHLVRGGKAHNVAVTAVAREMVGFVWAVMQEAPGPTP